MILYFQAEFVNLIPNISYCYFFCKVKTNKKIRSLLHIIILMCKDRYAHYVESVELGDFVVCR